MRPYVRPRLRGQPDLRDLRDKTELRRLFDGVADHGEEREEYRVRRDGVILVGIVADRHVTPRAPRLQTLQFADIRRAARVVPLVDVAPRMRGVFDELHAVEPAVRRIEIPLIGDSREPESRETPAKDGHHLVEVLEPAVRNALGLAVRALAIVLVVIWKNRDDVHRRLLYASLDVGADPFGDLLRAEVGGKADVGHRTVSAEQAEAFGMLLEEFLLAVQVRVVHRRHRVMAVLHLVLPVAMAVDVDVVPRLPGEEFGPVAPVAAVMEAPEPNRGGVVEAERLRELPFPPRREERAVLPRPEPADAKFAVQEGVDRVQRRPRLIAREEQISALEPVDDMFLCPFLLVGGDSDGVLHAFIGADHGDCDPRNGGHDICEFFGGIADDGGRILRHDDLPFRLAVVEERRNAECRILLQVHACLIFVGGGKLCFRGNLK